jgi:hypothetical protein
MPTDTRTQRDVTGYGARPVTKAPDWHGLVAWDMLFNNLTTGLFLAAALGELTSPVNFMLVARVAYPLALVLLIVDLSCLVLDLGDPLRFHHMLRVFKPTSPMSLGTWCLAIYSIPLTLATVLSLSPPGWSAVEWIRRAVVILGLFPALGSAVYKGVLLSTTSQLGWRDARWLGGYLTSAALVLGSAEMLALSVLMGQETAASILRLALTFLIVVNAVPLFLVITELWPELSRIYTRRQLLGLAALCIGVGVLVPLGLLPFGRSSLSVLFAVFLLLLGNLSIRFVIVRLPHIDSVQK